MTSLKISYHGYVPETHDALLLFQAALDGLITPIDRRPLEGERRALIKSGSVFIFFQRKSSIRRWTDHINWSPSRILGNFLLYRQLDRPSERGGFLPKHYADEASADRSDSASPRSSASPVSVNAWPASTPENRHHRRSSSNSTAQGSLAPLSSTNHGSNDNDPDRVRNGSPFHPSLLGHMGQEPGSGPGQHAQAAAHAEDKVKTERDDGDDGYRRSRRTEDGGDGDDEDYEEGSAAGLQSSAATATPEEESLAYFLEEGEDGFYNPEWSLYGSLVKTNPQKYTYLPGGLVKKTLSVKFGDDSLHLISYYRAADVLNKKLDVPSRNPQFTALSIHPELMQNSGNLRVPVANTRRGWCHSLSPVPAYASYTELPEAGLDGRNSLSALKPPIHPSMPFQSGQSRGGSGGEKLPGFLGDDDYTRSAPNQGDAVNFGNYGAGLGYHDGSPGYAVDPAIKNEYDSAYALSQSYWKSSGRNVAGTFDIGGYHRDQDPVGYSPVHQGASLYGPGVHAIGDQYLYNYDPLTGIYQKAVNTGPFAQGLGYPTLSQDHELRHAKSAGSPVDGARHFALRDQNAVNGKPGYVGWPSDNRPPALSLEQMRYVNMHAQTWQHSETDSSPSPSMFTLGVTENTNNWAGLQSSPTMLQIADHNQGQATLSPVDKPSLDKKLDQSPLHVAERNGA